VNPARNGHPLLCGLVLATTWLAVAGVSLLFAWTWLQVIALYG